MKRSLIYLAMALIAVGATVVASAAPQGGAGSKGKDVTLKGEVIDQPCYDKGGSKGEAHKACALSCAKRGNQLAITRRTRTRS
jgi:type 1 fimbria pilin